MSGPPVGNGGAQGCRFEGAWDGRRYEREFHYARRPGAKECWCRRMRWVDGRWERVERA